MRGTRPGKAAIGGVKLPFESPSAGDGYAASSECVTRQMTPAERERYGEAKVNGKAPFVWRKKEVNDLSRLDVARGKLSKEVYIRAKEDGLNDNEVMKEYYGHIWTDVLNAQKREWGLVGVLPNPGNAKKKDEIKQAVKVDIEKPPAQPETIMMPISDKTAEFLGEKYQDIIFEHTETTALAVADEFYTLQEDVDAIDKYCAEVCAEAYKDKANKLARMQVLKTALENAVVVI